MGSSTTDGSRRDLFRSLTTFFHKKEVVIRPPYSASEILFDSCKICSGSCIEACEEKIIFRDAEGAVYLDFKVSGCSDCRKCMEVCEPGVLNDPKIFIDVKVKIDTNLCMAHNNTLCSACKDPCLENAIEFIGLFKPIVISDLCTGCGYCVAPCPSNAMVMYK